jgi:hypothetical protein
MKKEQMLKHYFFPNLVEIFAESPLRTYMRLWVVVGGWGFLKKILTVWATNDIFQEKFWDP